MPVEIPLTVIGGYLGSGKTTLLNALLSEPGGRRIGVIVNDFGELGVDASLVPSTGPVVNLANGCVCCTLGEDLGQSLAEMAALEPALDHIVVEASGVADPAAAAAWGTVPPFVRGGTIVLAAADSVRAKAVDRYVGGEVRRQIAGADLLIVTKSDLVDGPAVSDVCVWLSTMSAAPTVVAAHGRVGIDVVLGSASAGGSTTSHQTLDDADARYERWAWRQPASVSTDDLDRFLADLPDGLLRLKGVVDVRTDDTTTTACLVQVVGSSVALSVATSLVASPTETAGTRGLEAIGLVGTFDASRIEQSAQQHLGPS